MHNDTDAIKNIVLLYLEVIYGILYNMIWKCALMSGVDWAKLPSFACPAHFFSLPDDYFPCSPVSAQLIAEMRVRKLLSEIDARRTAPEGAAFRQASRISTISLFE